MVVIGTTEIWLAEGAHHEEAQIDVGDGGTDDPSATPYESVYVK